MDFHSFFYTQISTAKSNLDTNDAFNAGNAIGRLECLLTLATALNNTEAMSGVSQLERDALVGLLRSLNITGFNRDALIRAFGGDPDA